MSETVESALSGASNDEPIAQPAIATDPAPGTDQEASETEPAEPTEEEPKPKVSSYQKRIDQLLQRDREATARATQAEAQLQAYLQQRAQPPAGVPDGYVSAAEVENRIEQEITARAFVASCNDIAKAAITRHGVEFETAKDNLGRFAEPAQVTGLLEMIAGADLGNDEAADLYVRIGNSPDEIARLLSLSPSRRAMEITKLALNKPVPVASKAPAPIKPIGTKSSAEPNPETMTDTQFRQWFSKLRS